MERSNGEERSESKCRKDKDHDLRYGPGPLAEFRRVSMSRLSHWSGQTGSNSIFCNGCKDWVHKKCSGLKRLTKDLDYRCIQCQGTRSKELLALLGIEDLDLILKERRLCWYGHVEHSNGAVKPAFDLQADGSMGLGGQRWHGSS